MKSEEIDNNFAYHEATPTQAAKYINIRDHGHSLARLINEYCPEGREKSLAFTKLEEAVMWANAGIARN
jgi:hypothetical protein